MPRILIQLTPASNLTFAFLHSLESRDAFMAISQAERDEIIEFIKSLQVVLQK